VLLDGLPEGALPWRRLSSFRRATCGAHRGRRGGVRRPRRLGASGRWVPPARVPQGLECLAHVPDQMEAIRDWQGIRGGHAAREGIGASTITHQERHGGRCWEPLDHGLGGASLQHGHGLSAVEIHQQRPRGHATSQGELLDAQEARRGEGAPLPSLQAKQRIGADHRPSPARESSPHLGAAGMGQCPQHRPETCRLAGIAGQYPRERHYEDRPRTGGHITVEQPGRDTRSCQH